MKNIRLLFTRILLISFEKNVIRPIVYANTNIVSINIFLYFQKMAEDQIPVYLHHIEMITGLYAYSFTSGIRLIGFIKKKDMNEFLETFSIVNYGTEGFFLSEDKLFN